MKNLSLLVALIAVLFVVGSFLPICNVSALGVNFKTFTFLNSQNYTDLVSSGNESIIYYIPLVSGLVALLFSLFIKPYLAIFTCCVSSVSAIFSMLFINATIIDLTRGIYEYNVFENLQIGGLLIVVGTILIPMVIIGRSVYLFANLLFKMSGIRSERKVILKKYDK